MKKIIKAEPSGFCMGVRRAVQMVEEELSRGKKIYTLGPIIHNRQVLDRLQARGVSMAESPEEAEGECTLVIRAHGVEPETEKILRERGITIADGTCPKVKLSHKTIEEYSDRGFFIVILGDKNHGEVKGLAGRALRHRVVSNPQEADELELPEKTLFICQTTVKQGEFDRVKEILLRKNPHTIVKNMICPATMKRQKAVKELAGQVDAMVIVGGKGSANTKRLYQTALEQGVPAFHVETADDLTEDMGAYETIGVSAGASTPDDIIEDVINRLRG
ncbi:MAG: 4-hydroxy-3-methylbut-2-enyl diphosphate reductase [Spirochaetales bacterium]|nr:4-hydroxy-3-methylbut-2-enyl diphosphate reductase [Spirochaetales bacterium]